MTLLCSTFAAILCTVIWYSSKQARDLKIGTLTLMYWGASLMWLVDAFAEYFELGADYFMQSPADMLNDMYLGLAVIALGLVIWIGIVLAKDPKGIVKSALTHK